MKRGAEAMLDDLKRAGFKLTPQRMAIVRLFADDLTHPTAQELFERVKKALPGVSFATVYNTLDALANAGLSGVVRLGNAARFDPNTEAHHHAVCDVCEAVIDIPAQTLAPRASAQQEVEKVAKGFCVRSVERVYRGVCSKCSRKKQGERHG
jgi:Fur family peroxide stress response transcriptional regulator